MYFFLATIVDKQYGEYILNISLFCDLEHFLNKISEHLLYPKLANKIAVVLFTGYAF
jgi:hypothetical protein